MCDQTKRLIKAHIISRKFYEQIRGRDKYAVMVNANKSVKEAGTFYQAGIFDREILCEECERKFSALDDYGWQILGNTSLTNPLDDDDGTFAYKIDCDTDKIRRFLLSVLWRASVSGHEFYSRVRLGPYEGAIKNRLFDGSPLRADDFPTTAMRSDTDALRRFRGMLFQPLRERYYGLITHVLYLPPDLKFNIVTGRGNFPPIFRSLLITEPDHFHVFEVPKELMPERDFGPAMIRKMRRKCHFA
jgi:hypothetical protein